MSFLLLFVIICDYCVKSRKNGLEPGLAGLKLSD